MSVCYTLSHDAVGRLPPTSALFGAFLGYNPVAQLLPPTTLQPLSAANQSALLSKTFFPNLISGPFIVGLHAVFYVSVGLCLIAATASYLRGQRTTPAQEKRDREPGDAGVLASEHNSAAALEPTGD
ncbi:MAG TPA: hypothetical protein VH540_01705 [Ktedonobacterales bacterium]